MCAENQTAVLEEATQFNGWSELIEDPEDANQSQTSEESEPNNDPENVSDCEGEDDFTKRLMNDKEEDVEIVHESQSPKTNREMENPGKQMPYTNWMGCKSGNPGVLALILPLEIF